MAKKGLRSPYRNILGKGAATKILAPHMPELINAGITGLERFKSLRASQLSGLRKRTKKGMLNDYIVDSSIAMLDGVESVKPNEDYEGTFLIFEGRLALRFKYVEGEFRTSNVNTKRQREVNYQQLQFPDMETLTFVTFGYTLDAAWQEFTRTRIFCRYCNSTLWHIPVHNSEQSQTLPMDINPSTGLEETGPSVSSDRVRIAQTGGVE